MQEKHMIATRNGIRLKLLAVAALALAACGKQEAPSQANPPPTPAAAAPAPARPAPPAISSGAASSTAFQSVELTNNVDNSGTLAGASASTFLPNDKIYALVKTNNASTNPSTISAHWEFEGGVVVNDSTQAVTTTGPSVTTFHIEKPSGWPPGHYTVTISIDGQRVGTRGFEVKPSLQ
jgi:hypothetical protein